MINILKGIDAINKEKEEEKDENEPENENKPEDRKKPKDKKKKINEKVLEKLKKIIERNYVADVERENFERWSEKPKIIITKKRRISIIKKDKENPEKDKPIDDNEQKPPEEGHSKIKDGRPEEEDEKEEKPEEEKPEKKKKKVKLPEINKIIKYNIVKFNCFIYIFII